MVGLPPLNQERLRERANAVARIEQTLEALGHPYWKAIVLDWLDTFEGMELYLYPEEDPVFGTCNILEWHIRQGSTVTAARLASDLVGLPFTALAARRDAGGPAWDPLSQPFAVWAGDELVNIWDALEPGRLRDMMQTRLLLRLTKAAEAGQ